MNFSDGSQRTHGGIRNRIAERSENKLMIVISYTDAGKVGLTTYWQAESVDRRLHFGHGSAPEQGFILGRVQTLR